MTRSVPPPTFWTSRTWTGPALLGLLLLFALPTGTWAQSPVQSLLAQGEAAGADAELMRTVADRAQNAGLDEAATADLLRPAVALAERDLPTSPLLNKTLEGLAKQVPAHRMTPVLQQLQSHTQEAGTFVSTWLEQPDAQALAGASGPTAADRNRLITNIAEARQQDLPRAAIEDFLTQLPGAVERRPVSFSEVAAAVSTMPDLPRGRNPEAARELLSAALNAGYDTESLRQLPTALQQAQRGSDRPASAIARGAAQAIAQGTPAASVLRTLSQGGVPGGGPPAGAGEGAPNAPPGQGKPPGKNGRPPGAGPPDNPGNAPPDEPPTDPPSGGGG